MTIQSVSPSLASAVAVAPLRNPQEGPVVSLEQRLIEAFARSSVDSAQDVGAIERLTNSPEITSPEVLAQLQEQMGQYNVDINLLNVLVRKAVSTAETLLRAS
ncbi:type III secretion system inner rod subunit SctI [Pseudomonas sp. MYb118]|uniref:type III secretion system inner rod subunit SctI n=1 Tax=Pseudomonas sp. MYb118 TaxID=1848720 RepID=UPI0034CDE117